MSGEIVPIDLELVRKYCKKTIEIDASIFHKDFPPEIIVYRLPCPNLFFTYPIYARTIFIFVKSTFNENERIDRALFAHELGHAFHARFRNKRLLIPFSSCIISVLMLFFAFFFDYWWAFFLVLLGNMYLFYVSFINVEANTETDADLIALKIIESQEGNDAMKNAAYDLIKMRIEMCRINERNSHKYKRKVFMASIWGLCPFLRYKDRCEIAKWKEIIDPKKNASYKCFQKKLRLYMERMPYFASALGMRYWPSYEYMLSVTISLFIPGLVLFTFFSDPIRVEFFF